MERSFQSVSLDDRSLITLWLTDSISCPFPELLSVLMSDQSLLGFLPQVICNHQRPYFHVSTQHSTRGQRTAHKKGKLKLGHLLDFRQRKEEAALLCWLFLPSISCIWSELPIIASTNPFPQSLRFESLLGRDQFKKEGNKGTRNKRTTRKAWND